jgi:predicted metal-dependent enzyme (double-stranded beta helix superfamily)
MPDLDSFIADTVSCLDADEPRRAVREVLSRAMARPAAVAAWFPSGFQGLDLVYRAPDLTIVHAVWPPGIRLFAHDHRMWAAIGIYGGIEDNSFFRRPPRGGLGLVESGGKRLDAGDGTQLGAETVHAVANPTGRPTGAIHVYGGDFVSQARSQWLPPAMVEEPFDLDLANEVFARAAEYWERSHPTR